MMVNKYHNRKTRVSNGSIADSRKEARRYEELLLLQRAGKISDLRSQVPYELIPAQYETYERYGKSGQRLKDGIKLVERAVVYVADFVYTEDGKTVVEDVKGYRDGAAYSIFVIKRKLALYMYGIKIREI
jgi:hypothetical protein